MLQFVSTMAPHAVLSNIEGKNIQFRLHPDPLRQSSSSSSSSSSADDAENHARTNEILGVFNHMEQHRLALLPSYDIEEWGLTQSSLEEVFMTIVKRYEKDEEIVGAGPVRSEGHK